MTDLYEVLGIKKNASPGAIKKAFRSLAAKHHPDRGGDPEIFKQVKLAYDILSDPERRARYDQTGEFGEKQPQNEFAEVGAALNPLIGQYLHDLCQKGESVFQVDVIQHIRKTVHEAKHAARNNINRLERIESLVEKASRKFKSKKNDGVITSMIKSYLDSVKQELESTKLTIDKLNKVLDFLADYTFCKDGIPNPYGQVVGSYLPIWRQE